MNQNMQGLRGVIVLSGLAQVLLFVVGAVALLILPYDFNLTSKIIMVFWALAVLIGGVLFGTSLGAYVSALARTKNHDDR